MNMFHILDVDLLEQIDDSATVRLAPNDAESDLIQIAFITGNSSLEPLLEGLFAQIHVNLS